MLQGVVTCGCSPDLPAAAPVPGQGKYKMVDDEMDPSSSVCSWIKVIPLLQSVPKADPHICLLWRCVKKVYEDFCFIFFVLPLCYNVLGKTVNLTCSWSLTCREDPAVCLFIANRSNRVMSVCDTS